MRYALFTHSLVAKFTWLSVLSFVGCISLFTFGQPALAHIEIGSESVQAVLHISPNHHATAGNPATLDLDFSNSAEPFSIGSCNCTATITKNDRQYYSESLTGPSGREGKLSYTFPESGTYTLAVNGKPLTSGDFEEFQLNYPVLVYPSSHSNGASHFLGMHKRHVPHFVLLSGGLITFAVLVRRPEKSNKKSS